MRTTLGLAAALLALGMAAPATRAAAPGEVQKALQGDYSERDSAFTRKDIDRTLAHYAPDFTGVSAAGKTHDLKEERADFLHTFALPAKSTVTKSTIEKLTLGKAGQEATLTVHRHGILLFANAQAPTDDMLVLDGVFQDVWAKRAAGWLLTREQAISVKATMNGKPL